MKKMSAKDINDDDAQDTIRKTGVAGKTPQAWIGGSVCIDKDRIYVSLPQEKRDKVWSYVKEFDHLINVLVDHHPMMDVKALERKLGFMSHAALTMKDFQLFL